MKILFQIRSTATTEKGIRKALEKYTADTWEESDIIIALLEGSIEADGKHITLYVL